MASKITTNPTRSPRTVWTLWFLGISLLILEMSSGADYVQSILHQELAAGWGWLPAMGLFVFHLAEKAFWNCASMASLVHTMPLVTMSFLLLALGLAFGRSIVR